MNKLKWGFENEACGPRFPGFLKYGEDNLEIGTDGSPNQAKGFIAWTGIEFRTTTPWTRFPIKAVIKMLQVMQEEKMEVTATCGLHFHFSGITFSNEQFYKLTDMLCKTHFWGTRKSWVNTDYSEKYRPLRLVHTGHYEARIFNASNKFHGIYQPWLWLNKQIEKIMKTG